MLNLCFWIGNICNGLLLGNASIARGLTCCKKLARHEASRKPWSTKFPLGGEVNHIWPLAYVPLFPKTPRRASVFEDNRNKRTIGLPVLKLLVRSTANKELLLKMTWDLYINLSDIYPK